MATDKTDGKEDAKESQARRAMNPVTTTLARAHLECTGGPEKGQTFRCAPAATAVGRDASCEVVLTESVISRQHMRIERRGETWILKNLSANGTLVNRKPADEVVLADGDEIRLGAKTRLRFIVETVTPVVGGRPQFRPRATGQGDDEAAKEGEGAEEEKLSLFKRRKGLFIGLGIWLLVVLGIAVAMLWKKSSDAARNPIAGISILTIDDTIRLAAGGPPLRVLREETEGIICEDSFGGHVLVPREDLLSGKAVYIEGMRKAIEVQFRYEKDAPRYPFTVKERNEALGDQCKKQGIENYSVCKIPGKEAHLLGAVRMFQKALAYYGSRTSFVSDPPAERIRQEATRELLDRVKSTYDTAITYEKAGDPKRAMDQYKLLTRLVPEVRNPIYENVAQRMKALKENNPQAKF
jgi:hypothetical protein